MSKRPLSAMHVIATGVRLQKICQDSPTTLGIFVAAGQSSTSAQSRIPTSISSLLHIYNQSRWSVFACNIDDAIRTFPPTLSLNRIDLKQNEMMRWEDIKADMFLYAVTTPARTKSV